MFPSHLAQAGVVAMALVCIYALTKGRWPERVGGVTLALAWLGSSAVEDRRYIHHPIGHHLGLQVGIAMIDVMYAGLLLGLLLVTHRRWVIIAFGLQALIVAIHLATFLDFRISRWDFFSAYFAASWGILASLVLGTMFEGSQRRAMKPLKAHP